MIGPIASSPPDRYRKDDAILRVALADKVHNARSIVRDFREEGHALWSRFLHRSAREQLCYYSGLVEFFDQRRPGPLSEDLWRAVGELTWLVGRDQTQHGEQLLHDTPWEYRAEIRSANQPILESRLGG